MQEMLRGKIFEFGRLALFAKGVGEKQARLVFAVSDGRPRITVFNGAPLKAGILAAPMDNPVFINFLEMLLEVANSPIACSRKVGCYATQYEDNKRTDRVILTSSVVFGKSEEGIVFISLVAENNPTIVFEVLPSPFHKFYRKEGGEIGKAELSVIQTRSYVFLLKELVVAALLKFSEEENLYRSALSVSGNKPAQGNNAMLPSTSSFDNDVEF